MRSTPNEQKELRHAFMRPLYQGNRKTFLLAVLVSLLMSAGTLVISWLMQQIIDLASGMPNAYPLRVLVIMTAGIVAAMSVVLLLDRRLRPAFIARAMRQYKDYALQRITEKSISSFTGENTSTYISALTSDALSIETGYVSRIFSLVTELAGFAGAMAMMLAYSPLLTLIAVLLSVFPVIGSLMMGKRMADSEKRVSDRNESFVALIKDVLSGFTLIKSFRAEREIITLFAKRNRELEHEKCTRRMTETSIQIIGLVTGIVAQFGVFLAGAYLALSGQGITPGVVIVFVQLMNYVLSPISNVPQILAGRKAACALVDKLAAAVQAHTRREGYAVDSRLDDAIELKDVCFAYENEQAVLSHISARFSAGGSYAIVGGSGSGKSTLLSLLMGGHDDYTGEIRIDGDELRQINSDSLYDLISIVQQNVFVFGSTIRDNITMFREFDDSRVREAARLSGLSELMEARGENFMCGENGTGLSGGERQRVSIARCLLRGTPVLLVDEATAALDTATAFAVTQSILDIPNLTRIVVTHRLDEALLRRYDSILVLRGGTIAEQGTFDALIAQKGYFYSLYTISQS